MRNEVDSAKISESGRVTRRMRVLCKPRPIPTQRLEVKKIRNSLYGKIPMQR